MNTGELNKVVSIEKNTTTRGASGGKVDGWAPLADGSNVYAKIHNLSGHEIALRKAGGAIGVSMVEITVRYIADVVPETCRVVFGAVIYNIKHANNLAEAGEWLVLTCEAGANNG